MGNIEKRVSPVTGEISYRARVRLKGYAPLTETFKLKDAAKQWVQRTETALREDKYFPGAKARKHTVADLIDEYLAYVQAENPRRHGDIKGLLAWWKAEVGHTILARFDSDAVVKAQQKLLSRQKQRRGKDGEFHTLSPATVNRYMQALKAAINFGIRPKRWITANPVTEVKMLKEPPGRTRFLGRDKDNDELSRLLSACKASKNPHLFAVVLIGLSTGMRRSEIARIKWVDINAETTHVTVPKTKNDEVRAAPLTGAASEIVKRMREDRKEGQVLVFPSPNDPSRPIDFETAWRNALKVAALDDFHFHDLRHTFASYLAMSGSSLLTLKETLGHKHLEMVKRYAHLTSGHLAGEVGKMTEKVLGHVEI